MSVKRKKRNQILQMILLKNSLDLFIWDTEFTMILLLNSIVLNRDSNGKLTIVAE